MTNITVKFEIPTEAANDHNEELARRVGWAAMNLVMSAQQTAEADNTDELPELIVRVRLAEWLTDVGYYVVKEFDEAKYQVGDYIVTGEMDYHDSGVGEVPVIAYRAGDYGFDI